jgi:hypothetical protein
VEIEMSELLSVREIVKARDGIDDAAFDDLLAAFQEELGDLKADGLMYEAEELIEDHFGLEPDYLFDRELNVFG